MADSNSQDHIVYDPEEVIFAADGSVESMNDPDTGEVIKSDPVPEPRERSGPYDETDDEGNNPEDNRENSRRNTNRDSDEDGHDALDEMLADTLSAYGMIDEDGNASDEIEWNGERTRVRDLSSEDRREFLGELRERDRQEAAGTTPEEQELLDFLRGGGNLREALGVSSAGSGAVSSLSADEINLADIRQQYPTLSDEEVQEELADRQASSRYENKTGQIRERLGAQETADNARAERQEYEREHQLFVEAGSKLTSVLGFPVEKPVLDYLMARTASQEANGQSPFLNSLTPEKMLRLEYMDTYAEHIDAHYKQAVETAYKRGKSDALSGAPRTPSGRGGSAGNTRAGQPRDEKNYADYTLGDD